ncbi:M50 family metallopeptidase [Rossellomorea sp. BNER]|uniref:M50 family metallopeptidase n=1 Tax=Rossellomorea sp. BNER TaxID=2962031 RepID=UPI003AF24D15|nr:M50 family metallopeptidase [Rossellomorea sp. BNER]
MNKHVMSVLGKVSIHPLLWLVIGIAVVTAHFIELLMLLVIILIHELGHGVMAHVFSWRVKRISLLPFGGVAEMDEHGNRSLKEELLVIIAGPLQHVWLMAGAWLLFNIGLFPDRMFELFIQYNLMVLLFNLLPIWPLDGGKILSVILGYRMTFIKAYEWTIFFSLGMLFLIHFIVLVTVPFHLNLWIILTFLYFSLWAEWKQRRYTFMKFLLERYYGKNDSFQQLKPLIINGEDSLASVLERFQRGFKHPLIIYEGNKEAGKLDENELLHAFFTEKMTTAKSKDLLYLI